MGYEYWIDYKIRNANQLFRYHYCLISDVARILLAEFNDWFVHYSHLDQLYANFFTGIRRS